MTPQWGASRQSDNGGLCDESCERTATCNAQLLRGMIDTESGTSKCKVSRSRLVLMKRWKAESATIILMLTTNIAAKTSTTNPAASITKLALDYDGMGNHRYVYYMVWCLIGCEWRGLRSGSPQLVVSTSDDKVVIWVLKENPSNMR
jgi:hypothetical protein